MPSRFAEDLAALCGRADGPPLAPPMSLLERVDALGNELGVDALALLTERAALLGLTRRGDVSCGGATRLLPTLDGWLAVSLAREDDIVAVPAWLEVDDVADLAAIVRTRSTSELEARGVLLGLPVGALPRASQSVDDPVRVTTFGAASVPSKPLVVDLSSLWAGPLCARLLADTVGRVVKVESAERPDGARDSPAFFERMNARKEQVTVDWRRAPLRALVLSADVVIEASRPRALQQLGLDAISLMEDERGPAVWVSITGHGRVGDDAMRVAFGDDAAVAGGLVVNDDDGPCFCGDAIADPLTGIVAAAATRRALASGKRQLLDVAMARVAAWCVSRSEGG
jgi:hypothetical protein